MKKILLALGITIVCLCSCSNNITNNPDVDEPTNETKTETPSTNNTLDDETSNCLIHISVESGWSANYIALNSLTIKDKNGKVVGTGNYWGSYYVPYDGTLTINWKHRGYDWEEWVTSEYTFNVGSAHELSVVMGMESYQCDIVIGGSSVTSFKH